MFIILLEYILGFIVRPTTDDGFGILSTFCSLLERELMKDKEGYPINSTVDFSMILESPPPVKLERNLFGKSNYYSNYK